MKYDMRPLIAKLEPWLTKHNVEVKSSKRQLDNGSASFYGADIKVAFAITVPNLYLYIHKGSPSKLWTDSDNVMANYRGPAGNLHLKLSQIHQIVKDAGLNPDDDIVVAPGGKNLHLVKPSPEWEKAAEEIIKQSVLHWETGKPLKKDVDHEERLEKYKANRDKNIDNNDKFKATLEYLNKLLGNSVKSLTLTKNQTGISSVQYIRPSNEIIDFYPEELKNYDPETMFSLQKISYSECVFIHDGTLKGSTASYIQVQNVVCDLNTVTEIRLDEIRKFFKQRAVSSRLGVYFRPDKNGTTKWENLNNIDFSKMPSEALCFHIDNIRQLSGFLILFVDHPKFRTIFREWNGQQDEMFDKYGCIHDDLKTVLFDEKLTIYDKASFLIERDLEFLTNI